MALKMDQSLVGHSLNFCTTFTPAHLVGRTNCRLEVLWLGWCPSPSTGSLSWLQKMPSSVPYAPWLGVLARLILTDSWGFPTALGRFLACYRDTPIPVVSPCTFPLHPPSACSLLFQSPPPTHPRCLFYFPLSVRVKCALPQALLLTSFFALVYCYPFLFG